MAAQNKLLSKKSNGRIKMKTFNDVRPLLTEEDKETLMQIGFNYLQTKKMAKGVDSE